MDNFNTHTKGAFYQNMTCDPVIRNSLLGTIALGMCWGLAAAQEGSIGQPSAPSVGWARSGSPHEADAAGGGRVGADAADSESEWATVAAVLDDCSPTYTTTWDDVTCRTLHQGAYLGNGDFGVHLGGTEHSLVYYLGKNGFHAGNNRAGAEGDGKWTQHILNLCL